MGFHPSILVIDDEPNSLFGICQILRDEGYEVVPAGNGKDALEKLKANGINLVITDEKMRDMSGMVLLLEVKKIYPHIPVILITAYGSVTLAVEAVKKGPVSRGKDFLPSAGGRSSLQICTPRPDPHQPRHGRPEPQRERDREHAGLRPGGTPGVPA